LLSRRLLGRRFRRRLRGDYVRPGCPPLECGIVRGRTLDHLVCQADPSDQSETVLVVSLVLIIRPAAGHAVAVWPVRVAQDGRGRGGRAILYPWCTLSHRRQTKGGISCPTTAPLRPGPRSSPTVYPGRSYPSATRSA